MNGFFKNSLVFTTIFLCFSFSIKASNLKGKVTIKKTGEPLQGVSVYFPDIKVGTITDSNGYYILENLPSSNLVIKLSLVDFKLISEMVDLSSQKELNFQMEEAIAELNEIVITGQTGFSEKNRTPISITTITPNQLKELATTNIIDAIASHPGINQITTGSGISKPVIRGLGFNRVVVVNDGIRQEGQQWGDEHGIEVDEFAVNKVEIIKGPSSLEYGSDAMAGVIHFISAPTVPQGKVIGNVLMQYQTNNGLVGTSANIAGNKKGMIWDVRISKKAAHAYQNKYDGFVYNSGFNEMNFSSTIGINKTWGFVHLIYSTFNMNAGIVEGIRDSTSGKFLKPIALNDSTVSNVIAGENDFHNYSLQTPFQKIQHQKLVLNSSVFLRKGILKATWGWQQNNRKEFADVLHPKDFGLYFLLNTLNYDVRFQFKEINRWNIAIGVNGMYQKSKNKGVEFLIPDYKLFDVGSFLIARKNFNKLDFCGGFRFDLRNELTNDLWLNKNGNIVVNPDSFSIYKFHSFHEAFQSFSGSIGFTYQFNDYIFTKFNISKGYRAPNISELASNGVHEGTMNYMIGSSKLKAESSIQTDFAISANTQHFTSEINLFYNKISNFIFQEKLLTNNGSDSTTDGFTTFHYAAGNAQLFGGEISIDLHPHPLDWLHFENSFSFVQSTQLNQPDSSKYLPYTPPPKFSTELRANKKKLGNLFSNPFLKLDVDHFFEQNHFYAAFHTETNTPAYTIVNFATGADIAFKSNLSFVLAVNNLFDIAYQSHLSRLKYEDMNLLTGRQGVFNMGRNISIKITYSF